MFTVNPAGYAPRTSNARAFDNLQPCTQIIPAQQELHPASATASPITPIEPSENPQDSTQVVNEPAQWAAIADIRPGPKSPTSKTYRTWESYSQAYHGRYGAWPVWNAKTAAQTSLLIDRLGAEESPQVSAFYLTINDSRVLNDCHSLSGLLARAESYRTQWATGRQMNATTARQLEAAQANRSAAQEAARNIRKGGKKNAFL